MDNRTIESFFLADYERLREENDNLRDTVRNLTEEKNSLLDSKNTSIQGFFDHNTSVELVMVIDNFSINELFKYDYSPFNGWSPDLIKEKLLSLDDSQLLDVLKHSSVSSYCTRKAIEVKKKVFPFTVNFRTYKDSFEFAYDPDDDITELVEIDYDIGFNRWVISDLEQELLRSAVDTARDNISKHMNDLISDIDDE